MLAHIRCRIVIVSSLGAVGLACNVACAHCHRLWFSLQENALLEQDNKAHIAAWQAQLADMKARQAAAVAAARGVPQGSNGQQQPSQEQTAAGRTPGSQRPPTPSAAGHRPAIPRAQSGLGHADGTAAGLGSRKRSWGDFQQQRHDGTAAPGSSKASRFGVGNDVVEQLGKLEASRGGLQHQQQQRGSTLSVQTGLLLGAHDRSGNTLPQQQFSALVQQHSGTKKKKKHISARDMAARLLGVAARAAAAAPITRCCLIHLQPHGQQSSSPGGAAAPVGRSRGRSRKPGQQQQLQIQQQPSLQDAPTLDQPFLTCPWGLTVSCLKEILLQQLSQQGMGASANSSDVQLLLAPECGEVESGSSSGDGGQAALGDDLTVGQLYERWWGLGPEVQIQYRLLNQ